jgi:ABC-type dipeptide/oligopeptide/nickel transport system ATPase component
MSGSDLSKEEAFERIQELQKKYGKSNGIIHNSNEAKTRLLIIDEVLSAIGWKKEDFNPEHAENGEYLDYLLSINGFPRLIVEAKRIGQTFANPSKKMRDLSYTLSYFKSAYGGTLKKILEQVTGYAYRTGVPFSIITNGSEWFLIQVIPFAGQKEQDLKGYYFGNLLSNNSNFDLFWEIASKHSVESGNLEEQLASINKCAAKQAETISSRLQKLGWKQNLHTDSLDFFYKCFFGDITDSRKKKMLEKCFIEDSDLQQYQRDLKRCLVDSVPSFLPGETKDSSPGQGKNILLQPSGDTKGQVLLIVGSVGCGKSTLVEKVILESNHNKDRRSIVIKVDLINEVTRINEDVISILWEGITEEWKESQPDSYNQKNLKTYFSREIDELKEGENASIFELDNNEYLRAEARRLTELREDSLSFFTKCWKTYRMQGYGITLVIDNIDRASEDFQEQAYVFSHKLASRTGATIIVAIREFTFFRAKDGFLDVRPADKIIHLKSPNIEKIISRRVRYIEQYLHEDFRAQVWKREGTFESILKNSTRHAKTLKETFLVESEETDSGRKILGILSSISWHNVRFFLEILRRIHIQIGDGRSSWKEVEVLAALMTDDNIEASSPVIPNIYKPPYPNYQCYFLKIRLLMFLLYGIRPPEIRRGVKLLRIIAFLRGYGYQSHWVKQGIEELVKDRMIECLEAPLESDYTKTYEIREGHSFRASPLAVVMLEQIINKPIYLALIGYDIPFHDIEVLNLFQKEFEEAIEILDDRNLEQEAIDLLIDTRLPSIMSTYLCSMLDLERIPNQSLLDSLEISLVENRINLLAESLNQNICRINFQDQNLLKKATSKKINLQDELAFQPFLFEINDNGEISIAAESESEPALVQRKVKLKEQNTILVSREIVNKISIPDNLSTIKINQSDHASLIFWALVVLRLSGIHASSGVQITDIVNEYLVDDHNRKFSNNISRALRSPALVSQPWLVILNRYRGKRNFFGVSNDWPTFWESYFGEKPSFFE